MIGIIIQLMHLACNHGRNNTKIKCNTKQEKCEQDLIEQNTFTILKPHKSIYSSVKIEECS